MVNDMLLFAVGSVGRIARKIGDKNVRAIGLTSAQLRILFFLEEKDNVCQHDIENELSMTRSAVSGMLDGMESDGLIVREKTDDDKRRRIICITDYGKSKLNAARKQISETEALVLSALSGDEKKQLIAMLDRIRNVLEESYAENTSFKS